MFVRIQMGDVNTGSLQFLHLSKSLALDVVFSDDTTKQRLYKIEEARPKCLTVGSQECRDALRVRNGDTIGKDDVAADTEARKGASNSDGIFEGRPGSHERCRGKGFGQMELRDGAVDTCREAEIVSIDNKASSHVDLSQSIEL